MPSLADYPFDPDTEEAFRRGYADGVIDVMSCIGKLLPENAKRRIDAWIKVELEPWKAQGRIGPGSDTGFERPPALPRIDPPKG